MDYVGSLDSSRDLQLIHAKSFVNRLHLVLYVCVQTFDVMFFLRLPGLRVVIRPECRKQQRVCLDPKLLQTFHHIEITSKH